jgi:predicted nucleic acid-binding protein
MPPQIVIDTNVIFAALYSRFGASNRLIRQIGTGAFDFHLSVPLILQYEDVLKRNARKLSLDAHSIDQLLAQWCADGISHEIYYTWRPLLPDARDDLVLELAIAAGCSRIATHNVRDFRGSEAFGIKAVTPLQFLESIGV